MGCVGAVSVQRLQNETEKKINIEGQVATGWKQWNKAGARKQ